ncbi:MAG: CHAD domain-containing protein [Chloroflexaceae bacterium]|nr:CHAD domain-containing protein [Chloroflexaceae bacterium]
MEQTQPQTFGDWAHQAIAKYFHYACKYESRVLKDKDPEALHQMRVGLRRLRSAMIGFAPALTLPKSVQPKKFGKIARVLGRLRDFDVLQAALQQRVHSLPGAEQQHIGGLLDRLASRRDKALAKVRSTLTGKWLDLRQALQDWLENPKYTAIAALPIEKVLPDLLLPQLSNLLLHPGWFVGTQNQEGQVLFTPPATPQSLFDLLDSDGENLHGLRKEAKRVRYNLSLFEPFYGNSFAQVIESIESIQEILGQIQDSLVLREFIREHSHKKPADPVPIFTQQLAQSNYEAWQAWQILQQQFFQASWRDHLRQVLQQPSLEPVAIA